MIWNVLLAGLVASIAWFVVAGALYMNPFVARISRKAKNMAVRSMGGKKEMVSMYLLGCLVPSVIFAFVFEWFTPVFSGEFVMDMLVFGVILFTLKIVPRMLDMALLTTYPRKLLAVDVINGTIASFVVAAVLSAML